jgi:hypothetical protein
MEFLWKFAPFWNFFTLNSMVVAHRTHRTILQCTPVSPYHSATVPPVSSVVRWTGERCTVTDASLFVMHPEINIIFRPMLCEERGECERCLSLFELAAMLH